MRIVPRLLHDLLCEVRVATPQTSTDPVVLHCAFCGLCYPRAEAVTTTAARTVPETKGQP